MPRRTGRRRGAPRELEVEAAGVRTHALCWDGGDGTPLVLLHGVLSSGASWSDVAPGLATGRRVVAPDMPLHGLTRAPRDLDMGPAGMSGWLGGLLDALGAERADVCGLSMGGAVAAHLAVRGGGRLRRLVLVDAAGVVPIAEPYDGLLDEVSAAVRGALESGVAATSRCWASGAGTDGPLAGAPRMCVDPLIAGALEYIEAQGVPLGQLLSGLELLTPLGPGDLARIDAPTLAIWGGDDPYFPAGPAASRLRAHLRGCRVEVLRGVGHNPVDERPDTVIGLVTAHLV